MQDFGVGGRAFRLAKPDLAKSLGSINFWPCKYKGFSNFWCCQFFEHEDFQNALGDIKMENSEIENHEESTKHVLGLELSQPRLASWRRSIRRHLLILPKDFGGGE